MYKNVGAGTDGSSTADRAVAAAAELAPLLDPWSEHALSQEVADEVGRRAIDTWATGIDAELHGVVGTAAEAICEVAVGVGADLVVVGSKGMRRRVLGSVPNSVSHRAPCAVLIVKTD